MATNQCLTFTRFDLSYEVNLLCQHIHCRTTDHMVATKQVLCYVRGSHFHGILFQPDPMHLTTFINADWVDNPIDR